MFYIYLVLLFSLQPENILLYRKGSLDIKIADFGLSVQVREGQEMKTLVGTAEYVCKLLLLLLFIVILALGAQ